MKRCERCGRGTVGFQLHDYCAHCNRTLCEGCMTEGCCGKTPADSGMRSDFPDEAPEPEPATARAAGAER